MYLSVRWFVTLSLFFFGPFIASAASASVAGLYPSEGIVGTGTRVTFTVLTSGFTSPTFYLVDSFPGGANTGNLDSQGNFVWTPNFDDIGGHTFTITVSDSTGASATASQTVTVSAPTVTAGTPTPSATVGFGNQVSFSIASVGFTNPYYIVEDGFFNSSVVSYHTSGATFTWTPQYKDIGTHTLLITAKDGIGHLATTKQTITVEGLPSISVTSVSPGTSIGPTQSVSITVSTGGFTTPTLSVTDTFSPTSSSTPLLSGKTISWTPLYNDIGVHAFTISATEGTKNASVNVPITVLPYTPTLSQSSLAIPSAPQATAIAPSVQSGGYIFKTYLAQGSSGVAVTELQKKLVALGFLNTTPTGYFGALTKKAVQDFQKAKGLEQVGYVGPGTRAALNK